MGKNYWNMDLIEGKEMSHGRRTESLLDKRNYRKTRKRLKENQRKIVEVIWNRQETEQD